MIGITFTVRQVELGRRDYQSNITFVSEIRITLAYELRGVAALEILTSSAENCEEFAAILIIIVISWKHNAWAERGRLLNACAIQKHNYKARV